MHYYKFNISDWTLHTSHLSVEEEGVYFRLVNFYYDTEQPIPEKTQSVIRRLRLGNNSDLVGLLLDEYFTLIDGYWHHKRCDIEIEAYHAKADKNRANGKRGGRPKSAKGKTKRAQKPKKTQVVNSGNPDITLTTNHKPLTNNQLTTLSSKPDPVTAIFDYWVTTMKKNRSTAKLTTKRKKLIQTRLAEGYTPDQIMAAILNCRGDPWSMGANDRHKPFNDIELICRSGEKLESFIDMSDFSPPEDQKPDYSAIAREAEVLQ